MNKQDPNKNKEEEQVGGADPPPTAPGDYVGVEQEPPPAVTGDGDGGEEEPNKHMEKEQVGRAKHLTAAIGNVDRGVVSPPTNYWESYKFEEGHVLGSLTPRGSLDVALKKTILIKQNRYVRYGRPRQRALWHLIMYIQSRINILAHTCPF